MTIRVSKDVEETIRKAVRSGRFASADEMIASLVLEDARRAQRCDEGSAQESPELWAGRFQAWVDSHPVRSVEIDDRRESIYAGRGE